MPPRGVVRVPRCTDAGAPSGHARCGLGGMRPRTRGQAAAACLCVHARRGYMGRSHRGRLRTADGPRGSPEPTTPLACIRWMACGRTDAHDSPGTCVTSASAPLTRRCHAATRCTCVGACIGALPLREDVDHPFGIGFFIIRVLQRHGGRMIAASPGLSTLQPCPARRSRCAVSFRSAGVTWVHRCASVLRRGGAARAKRPLLRRL